MHLGRFHYVVDHLERYFRASMLVESLNAAANALEQYTQTRSETHIAEFRSKLAAGLDASDQVAPELLQPYAQQVIDELGLRTLIPPEVRRSVDSVVALHGFDSASLSAAIKKLSQSYAAQIRHVGNLDASLRGLSAEYTVVDDERAEFGLILPRDAVGDKLPDLSKEFDKLSNLVRAVNELSGQSDYDSSVVTISSSWWQIFLEIPVEQVLLWTFAVERIVALFKSNLEIKNLQKQLGERNIPDTILQAISGEVDRKIKAELATIAQDLVARFNTIADEGRKNEVETQLRQGLHYLARRMNQGALVELNVGVPEDPEDPENKEGEEPDRSVLEANQKLRERIAHLRNLREPAMRASETSLQIDREAPLLLEDIKPPADLGGA